MNKLLDNYLCKKYPKIFVERNLSPKESCLHCGLDVGNGWFSLIDNLCFKIQSHIDYHNSLEVKKGKIPQVIAKQVKEKFSGLRFYYEGGDDKISGMVSLAEELSYSICDECGLMNEDVGKNPKGWIVTRCSKHTTDKERFKTNAQGELADLWKKVREDENK